MLQAEVNRFKTSAPFSIQTHIINHFEELEHVVQTARTEITQVDRGHLQGKLTHFLIGGLPFDLGTFSLGLRSRGVASEDRITISMLTGSTNRVTHWSHEMQPSDVFIWPPGAERSARYYGGASVAVISLAPSDLDSIFSSEPRLRDPSSWTRNCYRSGPIAGAHQIFALKMGAAGLAATGASLSAEAVEFWKRAIVEAMTAAILENSSSSDKDSPPRSALRIVSRVEEYVEANESRPLHISEICSELYVSRRTLHRAFDDAIGLGPVAFLRRKRLCSVHKALRRSDPMKTTVAEVAIQHGFANPGRFSGDYHSLFSEYPSQTLGTRHLR
jgi:AraC-like DNA-binding protein